MKILVFVFALMAVALASDDECDILTRLKVKAQWIRAYSHGSARHSFAQAIWRAVFKLSPDSLDLFKRVHGSKDADHPDFIAHANRVLAGLDIVISLLDQPDALKAELDHLEKQHDGRHIPDEYFESFGKALLHVLPAQLGRCWDKEAWSHCYDYIAHGIKGH